MSEQFIKVVFLLRIVIYFLAIIFIFLAAKANAHTQYIQCNTSFWPADMIPHPHPPQPKPTDQITLG